jgi:hypothetical protein
MQHSAASQHTKNREDAKVKVEVRKLTQYWKTIRILIATIAVAALALGLPAAPSAQAAGLPNCVDLVGGSGACYELVWVNGVQVRMVFPQAGQPYPGVTPGDKVENFYVMAPQTGTPQGTLPFLHDHTVTERSSRNHGAYSGIVHGYFVLCSEQGITSGACVPYMAVVEGLGTLPLAKTVNGQSLTSVEPIEAAANAAFITLIDTGATFLGVIKPSK